MQAQVFHGAPPVDDINQDQWPTGALVLIRFADLPAGKPSLGATSLPGEATGRCAKQGCQAERTRLPWRSTHVKPCILAKAWLPRQASNRARTAISLSCPSLTLPSTQSTAALALDSGWPGDKGGLWPITSRWPCRLRPVRLERDRQRRLRHGLAECGQQSRRLPGRRAHGQPGRPPHDRH